MLNLRTEFIWTVIVTLAAIFVLPLFIDPSEQTILIAYAMMALSLSFIWGQGGILCFGQTAFFGLGGYAFALGSIILGDAWAALPFAIIIPAIFAAGLGAMMFYGRLSDVYSAVVTLVVTLILFTFMNSTAGEGYTLFGARLGGYNGIPGFDPLYVPGSPDDFLFDLPLYSFFVVLLALAYFGLRVLLKSSFGRIIVGIRENELRAELMGYDIRLYKTITFAIGGALAGLAGAMFADWAEQITPKVFGLALAAESIIWVIVGGSSSLFGAIVGAAALGYLKFRLGEQQLIDNSLIMGGLLILFVLLLPRGVVPMLADWFGGRWRRSGMARRQSSGNRVTRRMRQQNGR